MIQLNNGEIVAVEKDIQTGIDVGVNGMFVGNKKPAIYLDDRRIYPEPNTSVTINNSTVVVPDKFRFFTFGLFSNLPAVRYSDGSEYLKPDGSNYAITDFPFMIIDTDWQDLIAAIADAMLGGSDLKFYEQNYYVMPDTVTFWESISGSVIENRDFRIERVTDPDLPRTEQNKWRIYGTNRGTTITPTKYFLAKVTRDDYYGKASGTWVYDSGPASGKTAVTYDYDIQTEISRSTYYPLITIGRNLSSETRTYLSFEPKGLVVQFDTPNSNVLHYYGEFPVNRMYHMVTGYTSGAISGEEDIPIDYVEPDSRNPDTDIYPAYGDATVVLDGECNWIEETPSSGALEIAANNTNSSRTANVLVTYSESGIVGTKQSTIFQYRQNATFRKFGWRNFDEAGIIAEEYDSGNYITIPDIVSEHSIEFEASDYGGNGNFVRITISGATMGLDWRNGTVYEPTNINLKKFQTGRTFTAETVTDASNGECVRIISGQSAGTYFKVGNNDFVKVEGDYLTQNYCYTYSGKDAYVYAYIKDDDKDHFRIINDLGDTPSYESVIVSGSTCALYKLKYNDSLSGFSFYLYADDENGENEPITCDLVINYFFSTAVYNEDNGFYYENDYPNTLHNFEIPGRDGNRKAYPSGNDATAQIGKKLTINVEHNV